MIINTIDHISPTIFDHIIQNGAIENYLIYIDLPDQLKTNYGSKLDAKFEIKGIAEIITKDRRLVERLFDNLKYAVKK